MKAQTIYRELANHKEQVGLHHTIVDKEYIRIDGMEHRIRESIIKKEFKLLGKCAPNPLINNKTNPIKHLKPGQVPADRLYFIDKVVRQRGLLGRFGLDHSESLNYEIYAVNKPRDDHFNKLVCKRGGTPTKTLNEYLDEKVKLE